MVLAADPAAAIINTGTTTCSGVSVFALSDLNEGHVDSNPTISTFSHELCVTDVPGLTVTLNPTDDCADGDYLVALAYTTNSHVEDPTVVGHYTDKVCLTSDLAIDCQWVDTACPTGAVQMGSVNTDYTYTYLSTPYVTNAHFGQYSAHSKKVCCTFGGCDYPGDCDNDCVVSLSEFQDVHNSYLTSSTMMCGADRGTGNEPGLQFAQCNIEMWVYNNDGDYSGASNWRNDVDLNCASVS